MRVESAEAKLGRFKHKMKCPVCRGSGMREGDISHELTRCWACNGVGYRKLRTQDYNRVTGHLVFETVLRNVQDTPRQRLATIRAKKKDTQKKR